VEIYVEDGNVRILYEDEELSWFENLKSNGWMWLIKCRKNYYLCAEIIGPLARIFWLPTILGMPWCCG
jgi:hypothetical protein